MARKKGVAIHFDVTTEDAEKIRLLAQQSGLSLGGYLTARALGHKVKSTCLDEADRALLRKYMTMMTRQGINLNQSVKSLNAIAKSEGNIDVQKLDKVVAKIETLLTDMREVYANLQSRQQ